MEPHTTSLLLLVSAGLLVASVRGLPEVYILACERVEKTRGHMDEWVTDPMLGGFAAVALLISVAYIGAAHVVGAIPSWAMYSLALFKVLGVAMEHSSLSGVRSYAMLDFVLEKTERLLSAVLCSWVILWIAAQFT